MFDVSDSGLEADVRAAFEEYLAAYLTRRDRRIVDRMLDESVVGFGTGLAESTFKGLSLQDLFARDLAGAPNPVEYEVRNVAVRPLPPDAGLVVAELDVATTIAQQRLQFHDLRMSMVFRRHGRTWRIIHMHVSLPTTEHGDDEAYPVKELEERNAVRTRLVEERTEQLHAALAQQHTMAVTDPLTGLYNRRMLDEQLELECQRVQRYQSRFSVLMLDLDHFKGVNDRLGHLRGDRLLIRFADLVRARLRKSDVAGRWSGEEFLVMCHGQALADALTLAEDIRVTTEAADFDLGEPRTVSVGVAQCRPGESAAALIERADMGLYRAKETGRNRVCAAEGE